MPAAFWTRSASVTGWLSIKLALPKIRLLPVSAKEIHPWCGRFWNSEFQCAWFPTRSVTAIPVGSWGCGLCGQRLHLLSKTLPSRSFSLLMYPPINGYIESTPPIWKYRLLQDFKNLLLDQQVWGPVNRWREVKFLRENSCKVIQLYISWTVMSAKTHLGEMKNRIYKIYVGSLKPCKKKKYTPEIKHSPGKMMVGRWVSFWDCLFLAAMLNFRGV